MTTVLTTTNKPNTSGPSKSPATNSAVVSKESTEQKRSTGTTLATAVKEGATDLAKSAASASQEVIRDTVTGGVSKALLHSVMPLRGILMSNPIGYYGAKPLINYLAPKLDKYLAENNIELNMDSKKMLHQLLFGDIRELDTDITKALEGFFEKAIPQNIKDAFASGSLTKIATATGVSLSSGAGGILNSLFNVPGSNKFTSPFKFLGMKIPFINKLAPKFQPWAAGAGIFLFGGFILKGVSKLFKVIFAGGVLAGGAAIAKKVFNKISAPPQAQNSGIGGAMNALTSMAGAGNPAAAQNPVAGMLGAAKGLAGMFAKK
jgi:hypothetical protein